MQPDFWQGRPVLVTGATGLLGGWLVSALHARGAEVVALIRDRTPHRMFVRDGWSERVAVVSGSVDDLGLMRRIASEYEIQTVFHLAAQTLVGVAKKDPLGTLEANVRGTWTVLEAVRQAGNGQVIVASSDKAYGVTTDLPYRESHPLQGEYPYDVSKSCADLITKMYASTYELPVAVTRCGNLFGGGDLNFSRTIPGVILSTLRGEPLRIRSDGLFIRDFLYVEDAVDGYLCIAEALAKDSGLRGEAFNLSLGLRLTVLDVVESVLRQMGRSDLKPIILNEASAEIREQSMAADKAREILSWSPRYGMDEGLRRTIAWYRTFLETEDGSTPAQRVP